MKPRYIVGIIALGEILLLGIMMVVPVIIYDKSWWWFFGFLIFFASIDVLIGIIILIVRLYQKKPIIQQKISLKDMQEKLIYETKYDTENPDNLKILYSQLFKIGTKDSAKTPVGIFYCLGFELNQKRVIVINMDNPKERTLLLDPNVSIVMQSIEKIAENPPEEIREEITSGLDIYGRPITTTRIRKPSSTEIKLEKEKKEVEEKGAI